MQRDTALLFLSSGRWPPRDKIIIITMALKAIGVGSAHKSKANDTQTTNHLVDMAESMIATGCVEEKRSV